MCWDITRIVTTGLGYRTDGFRIRADISGLTAKYKNSNKICGWVWNRSKNFVVMEL